MSYDFDILVILLHDNVSFNISSVLISKTISIFFVFAIGKIRLKNTIEAIYHTNNYF